VREMGKKLRRQLTKLCVGQQYSFYLAMLAEKILNYKKRANKSKDNNTSNYLPYIPPPFDDDEMKKMELLFVYGRV